jgi:hypothetical protein
MKQEQIGINDMIPNDNILTYLQSHGNASFSQAPFCDVDNLILCCLSYLNWETIADGWLPEQAIALKDAAEKWLQRDFSSRMMRVPSDVILLKLAASSERFGNVRLFRYVSLLQEQQEQQFSATSFLLDEDTVYVAFRGTDNTLVGWKEDFNMSFQSEVPSQTAAAAYLQGMSDLPVSRILVGGHSKGGNLAVFAATKVPLELQDRIQAVYNNDGPGFCSDILHSEAYQRLQNRVITVVPQKSVVGMLLEHDEDYRVVASTQHGFLQHDPYSWCVNGTEWKFLQTVSNGSQKLDHSLKIWIADMTPAERERLVDTIFNILNTNTNAKTVKELLSGGRNTVSAILHTWNDTPAETRAFVQKMLMRLLFAMFQAE